MTFLLCMKTVKKVLTWTQVSMTLYKFAEEREETVVSKSKSCTRNSSISKSLVKMEVKIELWKSLAFYKVKSSTNKTFVNEDMNLAKSDYKSETQKQVWRNEGKKP